MRKIFESVDYKSTIGLCVDTQHAYASKMCLFEQHEDVSKLIESAHSVIDTQPLYHLNDSLVEYGCNKDRHANLGEGYMCLIASAITLAGQKISKV